MTQRNKNKHAEITDKVINHGIVTFNPVSMELCSQQYSVPMPYYDELSIDSTDLVELIDDLIGQWTDDLRADIPIDDFDTAIGITIEAMDSFYNVTVDLFYNDFDKAVAVAEDLDISDEEIYNHVTQSYIYDNEED